jgi:predicted permease
MTISQPHPDTPADGRRLAQLYQRLLDRLRALPGLIAVGGVNSLPMTNEGANGTFVIENGPDTARTTDEFSREIAALAGTPRLGDAEFRVASEGYFAAMRIPLLRGRFFSEADVADAPQVAVVNQALVRRYWPNENPIGKQLQFGGMDGDLRLLHVVGVAADVRDDALDAQPRPMVYVDYRQRPGQAAEFSIVLRGRGDPANWIATMRGTARAIDPEMPTDFQTLEELVASSLDDRRFTMVIFAVFAGAALFLAMVGLYGTMAYVTSQRTREIGIRLALGAQRAEMIGLILRQSFALVFVGAIVGVLGALAGTRLLNALLYGVSATDLLTYLAIILLLAIAAFIASFVPAQRASRVDPIFALRYE